jgi:hypothetical protein
VNSAEELETGEVNADILAGDLKRGFAETVIYTGHAFAPL